MSDIRRTAPTSRLRLEDLEAREVPSWTTVPATLGWPSSQSAAFNSNAKSGTGVISSNEVDVYNFYAPRSGTYTVKAGKYLFSQIDTLAGLYKWNGAKVAGNDNSGGTKDSEFTAYLTGGTRYALAITNKTGQSNGDYKWSITGPPLTATLNNNAGSGITSFAHVSLIGNSLSIFLSGLNSSNWYKYEHKVEIRLVDANGKAVHTGVWMNSFETGGKFVPGLPGSDSVSRTVDVSAFDLRAVRRIRLTLW